MNPAKALLHASLFVLVVFVAVGLSKPDCEDGIMKSSLTMVCLFGAFPTAGFYLGLKGKRENRMLYLAWGLLFGIPAMLAYIFFAFGTENCSSIMSLLGESIRGGMPVFTFLSMAVPLVITQLILTKRANQSSRDNG
ncbi:hypothetical protein [Coraliomargarita akajimensis]|uniref:Uncharacterized protein n=1 Tax=Coraliomargarita akajimensis (strain DSM 45221 / IAM 15411 / JCM 23193 / KCTC 12865 / 04OKA010-24) TaxID=583355 RepID=D5ER68_CORAD|nr:hypothetical protein [Coraliomargarita akajimensis]ADE55912.1 hypothetical protein Caka_2899 [Coraliomargarita akajimensis DSM 45221]